jgi:glutamine synthetase
LSVFLGDQLTDVITAFIDNKADVETWRGGSMAPGVSAMAPLARDITDRNRTSPFAFTGNKFEFRAVGSSQSIAPANIALNAAVACALEDICQELEKTGQTDPHKAAHQVLPKFFQEHLPVVFNGNNYAPEWEAEAAKRGLWNLKDSVTALARYTDPEVRSVFVRPGVLTERELEARQDVLLENYIREVHVETKLVQTLGRSAVLPVALATLKKAADLVKAINGLPTPQTKVKPEELFYQRVYQRTANLTQLLDELDQKHLDLDASSGVLNRAQGARDILLPLLSKIREEVDALELMVDDNIWPFPKYGELLWQYSG